LFRVYGVRATNVLKLVAGNPALLETISAETGVIAAEVVFLFSAGAGADACRLSAAAHDGWTKLKHGNSSG